MLKFSKANAKTQRLYGIPGLDDYLSGGRKVYSLDLSAGWTCPGANACKSKAVEKNGRYTIEDGPQCQFRCFAASQEVLFPSLRRLRQHNTDLIRQCKTASKIRQCILASLPEDIGVLRYHVGGDFFKATYLHAAIAVSLARPDIRFYGYTKSLNFLCGVDMMDPSNGLVTENFLLTASVGGRYDSLIPQLGLRTASVVFSELEAGSLPIDHDDSHAATTGGSFALLLHGTQPAKSEASIALRKLKGKGSYARK